MRRADPSRRNKQWVRQERRLEAVTQRGEVGHRELCRLLEVSLATLRRDLSALEARGLLERTWGSRRVASPVR